MNISYNWLRDLVETKLMPQELARRLTFVGLAVEAVHPAGDDWVLELDVTSNRGDCLSHLGVAREVAALESGIWNLESEIPKFKISDSGFQNTASVQIQDPDLCPRYTAQIIRGVKIAPSPDWMVKRLEAIGQRPLNNVADITNYVLFELGQPLHAFDLAALKGPAIIVRRAFAGEKMKTLDGTERTFDSEMLLICDAERAVAIGGVMGGLETEITDSTTDVLLEAAYFTPASVRRTSRLLGLSTEASKRFERGTDPENVVRAQTRAAELICELAGGTMTENTLDVYPNKHQNVTLSVRPERVKVLSGLDVPADESARILNALGFAQQPESSKIPDARCQIHYAAPSWRHDMEREEDLIEEVARHVGYARIPSLLPPATSSGAYQPAERRRRALRRALQADGYDEAINFSFISAAHDDRFALLPEFATIQTAETRFVTLLNSIIEEWPRMRPTLLPGLLNVVRHNLNHGTRDVQLFELGRVFAAQEGPQLPVERESWALAVTGGAQSAEKAGTARALDFYDLKGAIEVAVAALGLPPLVFEAFAVKHLRPGQTARVALPGGPAVGYAGLLNDEISAVYKFRQAVYVAELDLAALLQAKTSEARYAPLPRHPAIVRDLSLLVARRVTWAELQQAIAGLGLPHCRRAQLVDVYEGANIPENCRSVTLRLEYRALERTLRDAEVEAEHAQVVQALSERYGAQQRI